MNIGDLITDLPLMGMAIYITPDRQISIDRMKFEGKKEDIRRFCLGLPISNGASWRDIKPHVGGNGDHARLLVALGDAVGAWTRHPRLDCPSSWKKNHPVVLEIQTHLVPAPTPSECQCCGQPMGPYNSTRHSKVAIGPGERLCFDCHSCLPGICTAGMPR